MLSVIDFPGATATIPGGMNEKGEIAGAYRDSIGTHGFLFRNGEFSTADFPGATLTAALDINDQGKIAGFYQDADSNVHGYILDKTGFATIDDTAQSNPSTQLFAINSRNAVAGVFADSTGFIHNFLLFHGAFETIDVPGDVLGGSRVE